MKLLLITLVSFLSFASTAQKVHIINHSNEELDVKLELRSKTQRATNQKTISGSMRRNSSLYRNIDRWDNKLFNWEVIIKFIGDHDSVTCEPVLYKEFLSNDKKITVSYNNKTCKISVLRTVL